MNSEELYCRLVIASKPLLNLIKNLQRNILPNDKDYIYKWVIAHRDKHPRVNEPCYNIKLAAYDVLRNKL